MILGHETLARFVSSSSSCNSKGTHAYYLHACPFNIALLLMIAYLPQEALRKLQILQPLFVHSIYFGELGRQNSFLRNKNALSEAGGTRGAWARLAE